MKISIAIKNVESVFSDSPDIVSDETIESVELAIEAMEKQDPMKPDRLCGFSCRNCSGKLARQTDLVRQKYCHHCGQKLDWED